MDDSNRRLTVLGVGLAAAISVFVAEGYFDLWSLVIGGILLMVLRVYGAAYQLGGEERLLYSCVWALCAFMIIGWLVDIPFWLFNLKHGSPISLISAVEVSVFFVLAAFKWRSLKPIVELEAPK